MVHQLLDENWTLTVLGENVFHITQTCIPATVPGSVYSALLQANLMPDPYVGCNELTALRLMENDFLFCDVFTPDAQILKSTKIFLYFEGIDTIADIYLNGIFLGHTQNMHRKFYFDVKNILVGGPNTLEVRLSSPTRFIREANEKIFVGGSHESMPGFPQLRKAHCMFGWDWGPRLPDAGIYRKAELLGIQKGCLSDDIRISQVHEILEQTSLGNKVQCVRFKVQAKALWDVAGTHIGCELKDPDGQIWHFGNEQTISILDPQLWWPNGYGMQPLYCLSVYLYDDKNGEVLDKVTKRIGLRTVRVDTTSYPKESLDPHLRKQVQQDKNEGRHFHFEVNGLPIFAMGADYIPEDNILKRVTPERTGRLLHDAKEAHHNCIRVWGGGYYPDDFFYDLCDELGILVWQDFMFSCANYELTDSFEENIRAEFRDVIRRIRHHACLGLWCGNNEMETQTLYGSWEPSRKQFYDYIKIFEYILPQVLKEEDPATFYWPSSPSSGGNFEDPDEENMGDAHYWGVWHGGDPFTDYRRHHFRFLSEFGFQSFPCTATIDTFAGKKDQNIFSEVMEMHQRNTAANGKIMQYLSATYLYPKDFKSLVYCSQMLQLDAIRYGVEHFRRIRGTCMGTIVWQLNDIWPVASWSSIDYFGRWKALHYGEKRFFAPVSITCEEYGYLDQKPFVNTLPALVHCGASLHIANETESPQKGTVIWKLLRPDSEVILEGEESVCVPAFGGFWLDKMDFTELSDARDMHLWYMFVQNEEIISRGSALFVAPKHYHFEDPRLSLSVSGRTITVHAGCYAKGVCIESDDGNLRLSDNFFDMEKGERSIEIVGTIPKGNYSVRSVYDIAAGQD